MQDKWKAGNKDSGMVRLIRTPKREYYGIFSLTIELRHTMDLESLRLVGTDPGVRTFQTISDVDVMVTEVGVNDHLVIRQMHHSTDVTQAHIARMCRDQHKKTGYVQSSVIKSKITMTGCVIEIKPVETVEPSKEKMEARERRKQETMEKHERRLEKRKKRNEKLNAESRVDVRKRSVRRDVENAMKRYVRRQKNVSYEARPA